MKRGRSCLALWAVCLALGASAPAPSAPVLAGEKGVVLVPRNFPNHTGADLENMFERASQLGSFAVLKLKWDDPQHFAVASQIVRMANKAGLRPVLELSPIESRDGRAWLAIPAAAGAKSFTDPRVVEAFSAVAAGLADLRPPYLGLGSDVNLLAASDPKEFAAFVKAYHQAYQAAKRASPGTRVFVTFAWNDLVRRAGDGPVPDDLVDAFRPDLDVLALSSDPSDAFRKGGPGSLPASYYERSAALRRPGDRVLLEVAWRSDGSAGPAQQVEFIESLPRRAAALAPELLAWNFLHDVRLLLVINVRLGLLQRDGTPKPAFAAFAGLPQAEGALPARAERAALDAGAPDAGVAIAGLGAQAAGGIFDPSFATGPDARIWMSYSAVEPSPLFGARFNGVSTHLAYSDDRGEQWQEVDAVNRASDTAAPPAHAGKAARWEHEVSSIAYDPWAASDTRWKLLWHRYLRVYDGRSPESTPLFEHGWLELRSAADPRGPWSAGRKLFVGRAYSASDDAVIGPPEVHLDTRFADRPELRQCAAFTEPGMLARAEGIYLVMHCATGDARGFVAELRCDHELRTCGYVGPLLADAEAASFGYAYTGFSGTDLIERDGRAYLIATPTRQPGDTYHGCLLFRLASLERAQLDRTSGRPDVALEVRAEGPVFNGACGYAGARSTSGVFLSEFTDQGPASFRILRSGKHPQ